MRNDGTPPRCELVDVRFRNGTTARGVSPKAYRWTLNDRAYPPDYAFDILEFQRVKP